MNNLQKKKVFYGHKKKAAVISIALNILLTFFKFVLYFFSGSIAILAEAWHSFSDIATSFAVFFAINKKDSAKEKIQKRCKLLFSFKGPEYATSFFIGILMLFVSLSVLRQVFLMQAKIIRNPLFSGICFIFFSLGSYIVYSFETNIGRKENSIALISDGMHSRADMVAALFTGFSLILYRFGLNIDRLVAIIIGLSILSFSIETIINSLFAAKESHVYQYRTINTINILLEVHNWKKIFSYFEGKLHLKVSSFLHVYRRTIIFSSLLLILVLYFSTSFYTVKPSQQAIIERLGRVINEGSPISSGLHIKLPWPFDSAIKIDSRLIREISVGNIFDKGSYALIWTKEHGAEEAFLSADNFLFYPYIVLHYKIKDIFAYRYHNEDPQRLLDNVAHDVITKIFVTKTFYESIILYRKQLGVELLQRLQSKLDKINSGLEIVSVNMKDIHPPISIASFFEEVIAAYQEKETIINQAYAYQFESLPQARSEAEKQVKEAESYVFDKIKKAEGEGKRFSLRLMAYDHFPSILNKWMYYNYLGQALQECQKIIIDPAAGVPEYFFGMEDEFPYLR